MIDNPVEVEQLMQKMESQLPIPARVTSALVRFLRKKGIKLPASRRVEIESLHYLGDEGGIACGLKKPDSNEAVVVSLTPYSKNIRTYRFASGYDPALSPSSTCLLSHFHP